MSIDHNIISSIELTYMVDILKMPPGEEKLGVMLIRLEIEVHEGIICYDPNNPTKFFNIVNGIEYDITSLSKYTEYITYKKKKITEFQTKLGPSISFEEVSDRLMTDIKYIIVLPKINACAAMIIKSDTDNLIFIIHIPTPKVIPTNFNGLFKYFEDNEISNITLLFSWVYGGPGMFVDRANLNVTQCINQDLYSCILSLAVLDAEGAVFRDVTHGAIEPKSYYLMYEAKTTELFVYCNYTTLLQGPGLFLFPSIFAENLIILIKSIYNKPVSQIDTYDSLRVYLTYVYFMNFFQDMNIINAMNITGIIQSNLAILNNTSETEKTDDGASAGGKRKFKSRRRRPRRNITRRQKRGYKGSRHFRQKNKY
jgi:hypothetical protein